MRLKRFLRSPYHLSQKAGPTLPCTLLKVPLSATGITPTLLPALRQHPPQLPLVLLQLLNLLREHLASNETTFRVYKAFVYGSNHTACCGLLKLAVLMESPYGNTGEEGGGVAITWSSWSLFVATCASTPTLAPATAPAASICGERPRSAPAAAAPTSALSCTRARKEFPRQLHARYSAAPPLHLFKCMPEV